MAATLLVGVEGYSEVVLNAMRATPTMGLTFGGDEKRLKDLLLVTEEDWYCEDGFLLQKLRGSGSSKIWNAPLILRLEIVVLVGVKAG